MALDLSGGGLGLNLGNSASLGSLSMGGGSGGGLYSLGGTGARDFLSDIGGFAPVGYSGDNRFVQKMAPSYGGSGASGIWDIAAQMAQYGFTRAIDSKYGPPAVNETGTQASFAGQDGQTYTNGRGGQTGGGGISLMTLLLIGGVAYLALAND